MSPGARYSGKAARNRIARKKAPAVPPEAHLKHWRKLAAKARAVAADPLLDAVGFVQAAEKAGGAVAPVGHRHEDSPFMKLVRLGKRFLQLTGVQRQAEAANVQAWATEIAETLDGLGLPSPRAPYAED